MRLFTFLLLSLGLMSCDPSVSYTKTIDNHSSYDIWLIDPNEGATFQDSILIPHNSSYKLFYYEDIGGNVSLFENCTYYPEDIDSISTRIDGFDSLDLDFAINPTANWEYSIIKPGRNGSCECRLLITNTDIN